MEKVFEKAQPKTRQHQPQEKQQNDMTPRPPVCLSVCLSSCLSLSLAGCVPAIASVYRKYIIRVLDMTPSAALGAFSNNSVSVPVSVSLGNLQSHSVYTSRIVLTNSQT